MMGQQEEGEGGIRRSVLQFLSLYYNIHYLLLLHLLLEWKDIEWPFMERCALRAG